ncbi:Structural maintenance of chromosomes protein 6 [Physocladia obscura]|uniref:Structural maintenance of chromosomes protein 6 n=1 Tax=Physocladia obscura TaxID=109957 RepID=A0AAD5ST62_9FUNG|nr:Structural maintenance of chromosomes protein 6 [Physocladia obscura]
MESGHMRKQSKRSRMILSDESENDDNDAIQSQNLLADSQKSAVGAGADSDEDSDIMDKDRNGNSIDTNSQRISKKAKDVDDDDDDESPKSKDTRKPTTKRPKISLSSRGRKLSAQEVKNLPPLTGVLERVQLYQFMCHQLLEVDFCPRINFVIGHNGSGKSAILTGIMVCLGGKADVTERAKSLKALVMEGKKAGAVTISIHNKGPDAYKPEIYGQTIIIERKITSDGTGSYKIKDVAGTTQSTTKRDLLALLDHMSIAIDNPLSILTQDTSRQFLASSTPKDKYAFFSAGTLLSQLSSDHDYINSCLEEGMRGFRARTALVPQIKKDYDDAKAKFREIKKFEGLEDEIVGLQHQIAWAWVEQAEAQTERERKVLNANSRKLNERIASLEKCEDAIRVHEERITTISQLLEAVSARGQPVSDSFKEVQRAIVALREQKAQFESQENQCQGYIRNAENTRTAMQKKIDEEARKLDSTDRNAREKKLAAIEKMKERQEEAGKSVIAITEQIDLTEKRRVELERKQASMTERINGIKQHINDEGRFIRDLEKTGYDRIAAYGNEMKSVLSEIEECTRKGLWRTKPIGPIGLYINLRQPKYKQVIEAVLGPLLKAFIVDNQEDKNQLYKIFTHFRAKYAVLQHDGRAFNVAGGEPEDPKVLTFYRAIDVSDKIVERQLILQRNIEKLALVETNRDGDRLATSSSTRGMPKNVNTVYTMENAQIGGAGGGLQTRSLNLNTRGMPLLGVDVEDEIKHRRKTVDGLQQQLRGLNSEYTPIEAELREIQSEFSRLKNERNKAMKLTGSLHHDMAKMQENLVEEEPASIALFEEKKAEVERELEGHRAQLSGLQESKKRINSEIAEKMIELNEHKRELDAIKSEHDQKKREINEIKQEISKLERNKNDVAAKHQELVDKIAQIRENLNDLEKGVKESIEKALQISDGERKRANGKTAEELGALVLRKQAVLRENLAHIGSKEEVIVNLNEKKRTYEDAIEERDAVKTLLDELKLAVDARMDDWRRLQTMITTKAKNTFTMMMQKRGFNAKLIIDHAKQTLDLRVDVHNLGMQKNKDKDPKTLSGGEKSFSTVCLLLSLWESMGNPFRALDEFDVFMDAVNRRMSMQNMISYARSGDPPCQYIFITPQDMSHVPDLNGSDVRVHRLRDPERNQARLNFQRVENGDDG